MSVGWNLPFIENTKKLGKFRQVLEIGCFEGTTSKLICDHLLYPGGILVCVDPLQDQYLVENITEEAKKMNDEFTFFNGQYDKFIHNTKGLPVMLIRNTFKNAVPIIGGKRFDFIYVDGDHRGDAVYFDAENSFRMLHNNGYILFDDYLWETTNIKEGIDRFIEEHQYELKVICKNYQVLIQKNY